MLRPRIIPCLLIKDKGLVKTVQFGSPRYVGDPINAFRIFNEKEVDELVVIDIDATTQKREPDYHMIEQLASECRMPLCYGGGIKNLEQAQRIFELGVEKIAISSAVLDRPDLIGALAEHVGSQSVVVVLDVKKREANRRYELWTHNGKVNTGKCPIEFVRRIAKSGVGEVIVNSIDNDGLMNGYDIELIEKFRGVIDVPLTALGGAGSLQDIGLLIARFGIIGASAGSLFVFKGSYKAVLINYPNRSEKEELIRKSFLLAN